MYISTPPCQIQSSRTPRKSLWPSISSKRNFCWEKWELSSSDSHTNRTAFRGKAGSLAKGHYFSKSTWRNHCFCLPGLQSVLITISPVSQKRQERPLLRSNYLKCARRAPIYEEKQTFFSCPYRIHTGLQDPLCPGVSKGNSSALTLQVGLYQSCCTTTKTPVPYSSSLLYDALCYFPSSFQSSSWEVAPAPVFNIGFNYLEEGL